MNPDKEWEKINQKIEALDLSQFHKGGAQHFLSAEVKASPGEVLGKVCTLFRAVRPIFAGLGGVFFLPNKWRATLNTFVSLMDGLCPGK